MSLDIMVGMWVREIAVFLWEHKVGFVVMIALTSSPWWLGKEARLRFKGAGGGNPQSKTTSEEGEQNEERQTQSSIWVAGGIIAGFSTVIVTAWSTYTLNMTALARVEKTHQHNLEDQFIRASELLDEGNSLSTRLGGVSSMMSLGMRETEAYAQRSVDTLLRLHSWMEKDPRPSSAWSDFTSKRGRTNEEIVSQEVLKTIRNIAEEELPNDAVPLDFSGRYIRGAHLEKTHLKGANFLGARLEGTDFSLAKLKDANFGNAHLKGANFFVARLEDANFLHARLEDTDFSLAKLEGANFRNAHLKGASFLHARLEGTNFRNAHLKGAHFGDAHLEGADLSGAHLEDADFSLAKLEGANFRDAHLKGAHFGNAHLESVQFSPSTLKEKYFWKGVSQALLGRGVLITGDMAEVAAAETPDNYVWLSKDAANSLYKQSRGAEDPPSMPDNFRAFKRKNNN